MFNINWISSRDIDEGAGLLARYVVLCLAVGIPLSVLIGLATLLDPLGLLPPLDVVFNGEKPDPPGLLWKAFLDLLVIAAIAGVVFRPLLRSLQTKARVAADEKARMDEEAERQWLLDEPPPLAVPGRFSEQWFAATIPSMHPGQWPILDRELQARGWTTEKIDTRLSRYVSQNPYVEKHHELTTQG